jgi:HSP20 family protein
MAKQQTGERPNEEQPRGQAGQAGQGAAPGQPPAQGRAQPTGRSAASEGRTDAMTGAAGGVEGSDRTADRERQRTVSREGSTSASTGSTGMQRTDARRAGMGGLSRTPEQPSLLPALMANPWLMTNAFMSNPFGFAQAMSREMDRLFGGYDAGAAPGGALQGGALQGGALQRGAQPGARGPAHWAPQMELFQRGNELVVRADLPGLTPDDVEIEIDDGVLTISGERRQTAEDRQEGFYRSERSYGSFSRSIPLPEGVDEDAVGARFDHGVLEVTVPMPQSQRSRGRRVQIQSGAAPGGEPRRPADASREAAASGSADANAASGARGADRPARPASGEA